MTTTERSGGRWRYVILAVVVLLLLGTTVAIVSYNSPASRAPSHTGSVISSVTPSSNTGPISKTDQSTSTSTTSTVRTCTDIPAISYVYCGGTLRISAVGTPGAGPGAQSTGGSWNFTVSISSNSVVLGQTILLDANLTNIGPNMTFSEFVRPYINPAVYAANGTEVWAWDPPQSIWPNWTIASGETTSEDVIIPTSQLLAGQSYYITVAPISIQFPTPNNLTFSFQFFVTSGSSSASAASEACYSNALPTNSSGSAGQSTLSRTVFNVTQEFNSWNWTPLSTFTVGSYTFNLVGSQNSQTTVYLEPQVFINVTNSQGQTERIDMTNLGNWNGQGWPPGLSGGPHVLFGANVTIQWLFPCNNHDVYLEVITYGG